MLTNLKTSSPCSIRTRRVSTLATWALGVVVPLALALPSAAAAVAPTAFDVRIDGTPPVDIKPGPNDCALNGMPPTQSVCTIDYANAETLSSTMKGNVTDIAAGTSGTITLVCSWNLRMHAVSTITLATMAMTFNELNGGGDQNCSWDMAFTDGSTLSGTLLGEMTLVLVPATPPTDIAFTGSFTVAVITGSGRYANATGSGAFTESETMPIPTAPTGGSPFGRRQTRAFAVARPAGTSSGMRLKITKGQPRASVYAPGERDRIAATSQQTLRVFGTKGTSCTAVARKGGTQVGLGSAKDGSPRDGRVIFSKKLSTLGKGMWKLKATCMVPRPGKKPIRSIARRTIVRT